MLDQIKLYYAQPPYLKKIWEWAYAQVLATSAWALSAQTFGASKHSSDAQLRK